MDDGYWPLSILMLLCFLLIDALLYGFGAALQNMNISNLEKAAEEGSDRAGRLLKLIDRPVEFINTVQGMTNLIGIAAGAFVLPRLGGFFYHLTGAAQETREMPAYAACCIAAAVVLTALIISAGIIIPKKMGAKHPESWGYGVYPVIRVIVNVLKPFTLLVSGISALVLKPMGIDVNSPDDNVTEEDIMMMVTEGHEQGVLEADEAEMITKIFEMSDTEAGDIMTHRKNIAAIDVSMTLDEAVTFILTKAKNSRFPVYAKDIDDIVGILHMRDALNWAEEESNRTLRLSELDGLLREPHFIPETRHIDILFKEMQSKKIHMEIVVDEYGQTAGIVTMEDILEEIVGNILDEYDEEEEMISMRDDGSILFDGLTHLEDVTEILEIELEEEDRENYDTLNGLLISRLGRIPMDGEQPEVEYKGYLFRVLFVENRIIREVAAVKQEQREERPSLDETAEPG